MNATVHILRVDERLPLTGSLRVRSGVIRTTMVRAGLSREYHDE
jgi:hypothetical protein